MPSEVIDILKEAKEYGYKYVVIGNNRCNKDVWITNDKEQANKFHELYRSFGSKTTTYEDGLVMKVSM